MFVNMRLRNVSHSGVQNISARQTYETTYLQLYPLVSLTPRYPGESRLNFLWPFYQMEHILLCGREHVTNLVSLHTTCYSTRGVYMSRHIPWTARTYPSFDYIFRSFPPPKKFARPYFYSFPTEKESIFPIPSYIQFTSFERFSFLKLLSPTKSQCIS